MTKKKHSLLAIVSCLLLLAMAIGFTSLYLTDNDTATNTVTVGDVKIDLLEPNWEDTNNVVPNQELTKDPQIKNVGINDAVVFMTVEVPIENITITADDGTKGVKGNNELFWFKDAADGASVHANNFDTNWVHLETRDTGANLTGATRTYVFAYKTPISKDETTTALFDKIQVKNFIENEIPAGKTEQIKINAYGIQASDVLESGVDLTDTLSNANLDKIYGIFIKQAFNQTTPERQDLTYNVENTDVQTYMAQPAYDSSDYSYTYMNGPSTTKINAQRPASGTLTVPDGATTITVTSSTDSKSFTDTLSGTSYAVENLIPGVSYTYEMKDSSNTVVKTGTITPTGQVRMINGGGSTENIRDLGGWAADGGTLKYGLLYRGARLQNGTSDSDFTPLTTQQKSLFRDFLGIESELNLRGPSEDNNEHSALGNDINYLNKETPAYSIGVHYDIKEVADELKWIVNELKSGNPVYFHCAVGLDRTATVAFVIEALCGVNQSDLDRDYEISFTEPRTRSSAVASGTYGGQYRETLVKQLNNECLGNNMRDKVVNWAINKGVTIDEINDLRRIMINGNPEILTVLDSNVFNASTSSLNSKMNSAGTTESYTSGDGASYLVTDYIPLHLNDVISYESDYSSDNTNHTNIQFYDENKNLLNGCNFTGGNEYWVYGNDRSEGTIKHMRMNYYKSAMKNAKYFRICLGYYDINNVSVNILRYS